MKDRRITLLGPEGTNISIFLLFLFFTHASFKFQTLGICQSKTFFPELKFNILIGNFCCINESVEATPGPVKLLLIGQSFFANFIMKFSLF